MQMLNVVPFKISASSTISEALRILGMLNQNITNTLTHFDDDAEYYCMDIKNIAMNKKGRDYVNSPLKKIQGERQGLFAIFNEQTGEVLYIGSSIASVGTKYFYPAEGSGNSWVIRFINNHNELMQEYVEKFSHNQQNFQFAKYIDDYSIFFLCLKPSNNSSRSLEDVLIELKFELKQIVKTTI